jgi:hypothetical protein
MLVLVAMVALVAPALAGLQCTAAPNYDFCTISAELGLASGGSKTASGTVRARALPLALQPRASPPTPPN